MKKTALILVDIQNDYFPGGKMLLEGSIEASLQARKVLGYFRGQQLPLVHIQHLSVHPRATFFLKGSEGAEIHENVKPGPDETVFQKYFPNAFRETPLLDHLRQLQIGRVIIGGMMTHMCVDATVRAAFDNGFECVVLGDCCATRALSHQGLTIPANHVHGAFLAALGAIYARTLEAEGFLSEIKQDSGS